MKVICTSPSFARYDAAPIDTLRQQGFELITLPADAPLSALAPHLADTVALIVAFTEVNDALLSLAPQLKIVCKHGVGVDNIDLDATRARGIYVTNVPDANKHAVADFAFALILNSARQITTAAIETRAGHWPRIFATDVYGKTLGIIGLGNIGKQVALRAKGFNMRILAFDFYPDDAFAAEHGRDVCQPRSADGAQRLHHLTYAAHRPDTKPVRRRAPEAHEEERVSHQRVTRWRSE